MLRLQAATLHMMALQTMNNPAQRTFDKTYVNFPAMLTQTKRCVSNREQDFLHRHGGLKECVVGPFDGT
jgi:hypothetical protein